MGQRGFIPILVLIMVLVTALGAGGAYYYTNEVNKPKMGLTIDREVLNKPINEATTSNQPVKDVLSPTPLVEPTAPVEPIPTHQLTAMEILRNRQSLTPTSPASIPTFTPTPTKVMTPTPTPLVCPVNTAVTDTKVVGDPSGATLSFSPNTGTYKPGDNFSVDLKIDPNGHGIDAIDAIYQYDSSKLTLTSIIGKIGTYNQTTLPYGNSISLIDNGYTGMFDGGGTIAVLNFKVNSSASGNAEIKFDFDPNNLSKTIDSNVVERHTVKDVLGAVVNGSYTIRPAGCN
ncbi:MAG: cohesin domain-containing protein [Patescibacteria group bacterium]|nr:cohesin domain-containing protein [Patescibacteria group bacterium]